MTSNTNMGLKRTPPKTYAAFKHLPSLRGRDSQKEGGTNEKKFHRPPQYADQMLFPGRRLDRFQRSTYSGYSGRSLDIETVVSGGRGDSGSQVGSAHHGSLPSAGFSRSLNDVSEQPWETMRQLPTAHSHMSLFSRQKNLTPKPITGRKGGLLSSFPGASMSVGNLSNTGSFFNQHLNASTNAGQILTPNVSEDPGPIGVPVSTARWKHADLHKRFHSNENLNCFTNSKNTKGGGENKLQDSSRKPVNNDSFKVLRELSSPDSSYSSDSISEPIEPSPRRPVKTQQRKSTPSVCSDRSSQDYKHLKLPTGASAVSPTPQLDKILWALGKTGNQARPTSNPGPAIVPDEFANISDTGVSDMDPSLQDTAASTNYIDFTDLEATDCSGGCVTSRVPTTPRRPTLTEETLSQYTRPLASDDRIMQWLTDCDKQTISNGLPTHLPDISYTFKYVQSTS